MHKHFYTLPSGAPFLRLLVRGLGKRLDADALRRAVIFVPTRRAVAALREAFLEEGGKTGDAALLLPSIRTLADVQEDELLLGGDRALAESAAALPPAISPMRRRFLLMRLVMARKASLPPDQAYLLADTLGHLIDQTLIEGADLAKLHDLVPESYALHWQEIREFLAIVHQFWPAILAEEGVIDAVDRRQRFVVLLTRHWQKEPPDYPVIAAGSTGSQPVTAELLKVIAALPKGAVILPGLDTNLEEEAWQVLEPTHPQYLIARLLKRCEVGRDEVKAWAEEKPAADRALLLSETMRPASVADRWRHLRFMPQDAPWRAMRALKARTEHQEAFAAALLLRETLEQPGRRAALVTPDRMLAARVAALLRRWGIEIDDSAGTQLGITPAGSYLNLLLAAVREDAKPSDLMAFLKHPFTGCGHARMECLRLARHAEKSFFRKGVCGEGLATWLRLAEARHTPQDPESPMPFLGGLARLFAPLLAEEEQPFSVWLAAMTDVANACLAEKDSLWTGPEGEVLATLLDQMAAQAFVFSCHFADAAAIVAQAMRQEPVRRPYGQHPRLAILGLLEARLLDFDHVVLAGLNEGVWPQLAAPDPWMSRAMRQHVELAPADQRIGQMAHDFVQLAASSQVSLLYSERQGTTPVLPSRWLLRLEAVLEMCGAKDALLPEAPWLSWADALDRAEMLAPCAPPAAPVRLETLPASISVSDIELWVRDPYAFYARKILGLRAQGALDAEMTAREKGSALHATLEYLARTYADSWPVEAQKAFTRHMEKILTEMGASEDARILLRARLPDLAESYWHFEKERRATTMQFFTECKGARLLDFGVYKCRMTARADRIDVLNDGTLSILDYKTGGLPSQPHIEAGFKPQLTLEALMAETGAFEGPGARTVSEIAYVAFNEGKGAVDLKPVKLAPDVLRGSYKDGFKAFIAAFLQEDAVFHAAPRPQRLAPAEDYARLARVAEWSKGALAQEDSEG